MDKDSFNKYRNQWLIIGVPHFWKESALYFYQGRLINLDEQGITLEKSGRETYIAYDRIKQIQSSGSTEARGR